MIILYYVLLWYQTLTVATCSFLAQGNEALTFHWHSLALEQKWYGDMLWLQGQSIGISRGPFHDKCAPGACTMRDSLQRLVNRSQSIELDEARFHVCYIFVSLWCLCTPKPGKRGSSTGNLDCHHGGPVILAVADTAQQTTFGRQLPGL